MTFVYTPDLGGTILVGLDESIWVDFNGYNWVNINDYFLVGLDEFITDYLIWLSFMECAFELSFGWS